MCKRSGMYRVSAIVGVIVVAVTVFIAVVVMVTVVTVEFGFVLAAFVFLVLPIAAFVSLWTVVVVVVVVGSDINGCCFVECTFRDAVTAGAHPLDSLARCISMIVVIQHPIRPKQTTLSPS